MINWVKRHIIISLLIFSIAIYNIIWLVNYYQFSTPKEGYEKNVKTYSKEIDNYLISYGKPEYLQFTGNYGISNYGDTLSIILWPPRIFEKEMKYGVILYDEEEDHGYMFYVDKDLNYIADDTLEFEVEEEAKRNLEENHEELVKMLGILKDELKTY